MKPNRQIELLEAIQRAELALRLEPLIAAKAKENLSTPTGGKTGLTLQNSANSAKSPIDTRAELAKISGLSHDTIHKAKALVEGAPEEAKERRLGKLLKAQKEAAWDRWLWLNCESYREIGKALGVDDTTIGEWCAGFSNELGNPAPDSRQHFDVWNFQAFRAQKAAC